MAKPAKDKEAPPLPAETPAPPPMAEEAMAEEAIQLPPQPAQNPPASAQLQRPGKALEHGPARDEKLAEAQAMFVSIDGIFAAIGGDRFERLRVKLAEVAGGMR